MASSAGSLPLAGVGVEDRTTGIAGAYCTKLFADAGADVRMATPADEHPLRRRRTGALARYLAAAKRPGGPGDAPPDVLVSDDPADAALRSVRPELVVVTITPFGCDGPWAARPANDFTLQAACGSTGSRGLPDEAPLAAGGDIGEWVAGTYAAVGALAALREAGRSGQGEHVDVAVFDCMATTMVPFPSVFASFLGWPEAAGTLRNTEVPSISPTRDGYVVFTTNSAQQLNDFLVMIGHPELCGEPGLARADGRFKRRDTFLPLVYAYTSARTTAEVLEDAAAFRVPSAPVMNGASVLEFPQFVHRQVFRAGDGMQEPGLPYRISEPGIARPRPSPGREWQLPLTGVRVVDVTCWWAGPSATHVMASLGADVIKVEAAARPDGMRLTSTRPPTADRWWEWGPIFHAVNTSKRSLTLDLASAEGKEIFEALLATADVLVENYTPRVFEQFGLDWDHVHAVNDALVMVRMPAFGLDGPWRDRTGFAQTMESLTGMAWVTGQADGPPVLVRGAGDPVAGLHAVFATLLALGQRDTDGRGRLVEAAMVEAVLSVAAEQVVEYTATGEVIGRRGNDGPPGTVQGVFACEGHDAWVAVSADAGSPCDALQRLVGVSSLEDWCARRTAADAAEALLAVGVPAAAVIAARDIVHNAQLTHRRLFEGEDHPVTGTHLVPGLPFRFSRVRQWARRASPTLGEHNDELLTALGFADRIDALRGAGVIGEHL